MKYKEFLISETQILSVSRTDLCFSCCIKLLNLLKNPIGSSSNDLQTSHTRVGYLCDYNVTNIIPMQIWYDQSKQNTQGKIFSIATKGSNTLYQVVQKR